MANLVKPQTSTEEIEKNLIFNNSSHISLKLSSYKWKLIRANDKWKLLGI